MRNWVSLRTVLMAAVLSALCCLSGWGQKTPVLLYAGQSNADGRVYNTQLPEYLKGGYKYLHFANVTSESTGRAGQRTFPMGKTDRWAFCDVTNYFVEQALQRDFYAVKCAYGGTAIAPGVTAEKLPVWYADGEWMKTHQAYRGEDITQEAYRTHNSLTKSLTEGLGDLIDGTLKSLNEGYDVRAIMWHQGESDRNAADQYETNFRTMIAYMRQAIYERTGDEADLHLPFIFGTVSHRSQQYSADVERAQLKVAEEDPDVHYISMADAGLREDHLHFDSIWTDYLGKMMYNKLVELKLVEGEKLDITKPTAEGGLGDDDVAAYRAWDFSKSWSKASRDSLTADPQWAALNGWGYRYSGTYDEQQLQTSTGYVFPETAGLYFTANANRATINPGQNIGLYAGGIYLIVPHVMPSQYVTIVSRSAKNGAARGIQPDTMDAMELDRVGGVSPSTTQQRNVWWYNDNHDGPADLHFCIDGGGIFITKVIVSYSADGKDVTDHVETPQAADRNMDLYDLSGRKVDVRSYTRGMYIGQNRKFLVR